MFQGRLKVLSVCCVLTLSACGGGGGGSEGGITPPPVDNDENQKPIPLPDDLASLYEGTTDPAPLATLHSGRSIDTVYEYVLGVHRNIHLDFAGPEFAPLQRSVSAKKADWLQPRVAKTTTNEPCDSGSIRVEDEIDPVSNLGPVTIHYNECVEDGIKTSGQVKVDYQRLSANGLNQTAVDFEIEYVGFRTEIPGDATEYAELNGTEHYRGVGTCDQRITMELVGNSGKSGKDFYLSDLTSRYRSCDSDFALIDVAGRIYDSSIGYYDITTPQTIALYDLYQPFLIADGILQLESELGLFRVSGSFTGDPAFDIPTADHYFAELTLEDKSGVLPLFKESMPSWYIGDHFIGDFGDDDGDGMWNGYEIYNELDPNADDTAGDADDDGFNNYLEFLSRTAANSSAEQPALSFSVVSEGLDDTGEDSIFSGTSIPVSFGLKTTSTLIPEVFDMFRDTSVTISLGSGDWQVMDGNCTFISAAESPDDSAYLRCDPIDIATLITQGQVQLASMQLNVQRYDGGCVSYQLDASMPVGMQSQDVCWTSVSTDYVARVTSPNQALLFADAGPTLSYTLSIGDNSESEGPGQIAIKGTIDSVLPVELVDVNSDMTCSHTASTFECHQNQHFGELDLVLSNPNSQGHIAVDVEIDSIYSPELIHSTQQQRLLALALPMQALQSQIDTLPAGSSTLRVDSGIYAGTLAVGQDLQLYGENGAELWLYGEDQLSVAGSVQIDGFDIYGSSKVLSLVDGAVTNNQFYIEGDAEQTLTLSLGGQVMSNRFYFSNTHDYQYYPSIILGEGSLFANNLLVGSGQAEFVALQYWATGIAENTSAIINNSFVETYQILNGYQPVDFENNLIAMQNDFQGDLTLLAAEALASNSNNLLPSAYREIYSAENIYSDQPGIDTDGDYRLLPGSPAINSGLDRSALFSTDINGNQRSLPFDIGAYEFNP